MESRTLSESGAIRNDQNQYWWIQRGGEAYGSPFWAFPLPLPYVTMWEAVYTCYVILLLFLLPHLSSWSLKSKNLKIDHWKFEGNPKKDKKALKLWSCKKKLATLTISFMSRYTCISTCFVHELEIIINVPLYEWCQKEKALLWGHLKTNYVKI